MSDTARRIDPRLLSEIRRYGAFDITACFNCGNCTAVCPLSDELSSFPRKMIRSGQIGFRHNLLSGSEPWLCYYCGECSETCPREAEPGEYMAALRRYIISETDPTGIAKLFFSSPLLLLFLTTGIGMALALFLIQVKGDPSKFPHWIFSNLVAYEAIHLIGTIFGILGAALLAIGVARLIHRNTQSVGGISFILKQKPSILLKSAKTVLREVTTMSRHAECKTEAQTKNPWYLTPRFIHGFIFWGFLGLAIATALDFLFIYILGTKFFAPARIIGTVSGAVMTFGLLIAILKRFTRKQKHSRHTHSADIWLLFFLLILAISGFWLEAVVMFGKPGAVHDWVLLVHATFAMELILLIAVTKLAHAIYRPLGLWLHILKQEGANNV